MGTQYEQRNKDGTFRKGVSYSFNTQFKKGMKMPKSIIEKRTASVLGSKHLNHVKGSKHKNWLGGQVRFKCIDCEKVLANRYAERCLFCKAKFYKGKDCPTWKGGKPKCLDCQKIISYNATKCSKCAAPRGENSPHWIKDRTKLIARQERNDSAYCVWRKEVWLRDNFKCKIANPDCKGRIEAHHILGWKEHSELRYQVNNGITLCHAHHPRKRSEEAKLSPYFQELVAEVH